MRSSRLKIWPLLLMLYSGSVAADIYVFTDANGTTYFSNVPVDDRYELVLSAPSAGTVDEAIVNPRMLEKSASYDPIIEHAASRVGVDAELLRAVIVVESAFDEKAVSHAGAEGLMQLMPATARHYGVTNAFDPQQNIDAGARHLSELIARYDEDLELALAAYNAGEDAVERFGRQVPPFPETRQYVPKVLKIYNRLRRLDRST